MTPAGLRIMLMGLAACVASPLVVPTVADAAPRRKRKLPSLGAMVERVRESEVIVVKAERAAAKEQIPSEEQLAKRLVRGQLQLAEGNFEGAAITFLDLKQNYAESQAGPQAVYYLGVALTHLDMERWAAELFSENLRDTRPAGIRFHQRSVARLLDLHVPRRQAGFARRAGISATPEARARLLSVGGRVDVRPPKGVVLATDAKRLQGWAESFAQSEREPELRYAYGRYLFLTKQYARAQDELDTLNPLNIPLSRGGPDAKWRLRAAYVAAAAVVGDGDLDAALERFVRITKSRPSSAEGRQIVELAALAVARISHDAGNADDALAAYRQIGRDSPFFAEAMYETAWTLLAGKHYEQAVQALDLLLIYVPDSPIAPEIKQLRGKVKIQQRDYIQAEEEFLTLRREFSNVAKRLGRKLSAQGDSRAYFAAVVGEDMEHFSLSSVLPVQALPVARGLPRAVQAEGVAQDVGHLERELADLRGLLARMEEALRAREKARLFNDLNAHVAALDSADDELLQVRVDLVARLSGKAKGNALRRLEARRRQLQTRVEQPLGDGTGSHSQVSTRLEKMQEQAHRLDLTVSALRAQLVATEHYYEQTRKDQKIDHYGFLKQAAELRDTIAELELEVMELRDRIGRAQAGLRYDDPIRNAKRKAMAEYRAHVGQMFAAISGAVKDPEAGTIWRRVDKLEQRSQAAREALDRAAGQRLQEAAQILVEERSNLDRYLVELRETKTTTAALVGDVMHAGYQDVVAELNNLVMRSEVGLLDVAWSMTEAETDEVNRLEKTRDRDLRDIDQAVEMGLEDLGQ